MTDNSPPSGVRAFLAAVRQLPAGVLLRLLALVGVVLLTLLALRWPPIADRLTQDNVAAILSSLRGAWWAPLVLIASYAALAPLGVPVSPLVVGGGVVFGAVAGSIYNTLGLFLGALVGYQFASRLGREAVLRLTGPSLRRAERAFNRRGFWPLVLVRFLPLPFALVNFAAALAGVAAVRFLASSALGLAPATVMHTAFAAALASAPPGARKMVLVWWAVVWIALATVTSLPTFRAGLLRRRRYRTLRAARRRRDAHRAR